MIIGELNMVPAPDQRSVFGGGARGGVPKAGCREMARGTVGDPIQMPQV